MSLALAGCTLLGPGGTSMRQPSNSSPAVPNSTTAAASASRAVLDWGSSTIELPIDRYGMSPREVQLVDAAASIAFARCARNGAVPREALVEAERYLAEQPDSNLWLFGAWNAEYTAEHDYVNQSSRSTGLIHTDQATYARCTGPGSELRALDPISPEWITEDGFSEKLAEIHSKSYDSTRLDKRVAELSAQVNECIVQSSAYEAVVGDGLGGVAISDDWAASERTAAKVVEARCRDSIDFTQRVADIAAANQDPLIAENLSELVRIRAAATQRVSRANEILRKAGLA